MVNTQKFISEVTAALPGKVRSVILYGSAVTGDFASSRSTYNLLVVVDQLGIDELRALSRPVRAWLSAGNPAPVPMTFEQLKSSADVFPLELLDMKENRRVLHGQDVLAGLEVSPVNLRHQVEYELKSKRLQLEAQYMTAVGDRKATLAAMTESLSSILALGRGALRLFESTAPASKLDAMRALGRRLDIRTDVFEKIQKLKAGEGSASDPDELFRVYLDALNGLIGGIDRYLHPGKEFT